MNNTYSCSSAIQIFICSSYFHWSPCSAGEYHFMSSQWTCMERYPFGVENATFIDNSVDFAYSLDEQCRMEFGEGFNFCTSFQVSLKR